MNEAVKQKFCQVLGKEQVLFEEPMKSHTTFRIGGPAEVFIMPKSIKQVQMAVKICQEEQIPYFILGNGSNLLVSDIQVEGTEIQAAAGALLSSIAVAARRESLTGFEFAGGIPGTLGGAVVMNAGAYGGEIKDVLKEVTVMDGDGKIFTLPASELEMGYRTSIIKTAGYLVLSARITLSRGKEEDIKARTRELSEMRTQKQPLDYPSAGSTFKRPEGYFAGKLIMDSGLRGYSVGGAMVSEKHCGFVINKGNATAEDVVSLMKHVTEVVQEKYGVTLEPEVKFLGEFDGR